MKHESYSCDRCGHPSNVEMFSTTFLFTLPGSMERGIAPRKIKTGHLCEKCSDEMTCKFFNPIIAFLRGEK